MYRDTATGRAGRGALGVQVGAWACLCAGRVCWPGQLGQFGCLVHLTRFDSVFGLSTVPESRDEHCSSQNFRKKKLN